MPSRAKLLRELNPPTHRHLRRRLATLTPGHPLEAVRACQGDVDAPLSPDAFNMGPDQRRRSAAAAPEWIQNGPRQGVIWIQIGYNKDAHLATHYPQGQMTIDHHEQSLRLFEDSQRLQGMDPIDLIDERTDNMAYRITVTAYEKDGSVRWSECCLDADEFHQAMHEVLRDGLKYELMRDQFTVD